MEDAVELVVGEPDAIEPLDRVGRVPAGDDRADRPAALDRDRLAVHLVGQQNVVVERLGEREASCEAMAAVEPVDRTGV